LTEEEELDSIDLGRYIYFYTLPTHGTSKIHHIAKKDQTIDISTSRMKINTPHTLYKMQEVHKSASPHAVWHSNRGSNLQVVHHNVRNFTQSSWKLIAG